MNKELKTALIVAGVVVVGYLAYKQYKKSTPQATAAPTAGANLNSAGSPGNNIANDINSAAGALGQLADSFGG